MNSVFGLILGGGKSERFGSDKLSCKLGDETVFERSYRILRESGALKDVYSVTTGDFTTGDYRTPIPNLVNPSSTRFQSMCNGVKKILGAIKKNSYKTTYVLIHNAANPGVTHEEIKACVNTAFSHGASGVATKIKDTIRREEKKGFKTLDRDNLWAMQTPQCIRLDLLLRGIEYVRKYNLKNPANRVFPTDDLQLLDLLNQHSSKKIAYSLIECGGTNFKITFE